MRVLQALQVFHERDIPMAVDALTTHCSRTVPLKKLLLWVEMAKQVRCTCRDQYNRRAHSLTFDVLDYCNSLPSTDSLMDWGIIGIDERVRFGIR